MDSKTEKSETVIKDYGTSVFDLNGGLKHKNVETIEWVQPIIGIIE